MSPSLQLFAGHTCNSKIDCGKNRCQILLDAIRTCNLFPALSIQTAITEIQLRSVLAVESAMIVCGFGQIGSSFLVPMGFCFDEHPMKLGSQDDGISLSQLS